MKKILLTLDYELYGDGSGNIYKHIIEPTNRLLSIAKEYNAKFTFFVEIVEFWRIEEEWNKGNKMGYEHNPVDDVRKQLCKAYLDGHDVQLHLHPQWVDARYENGIWNVNLNEWRLGEYNKNGDFSLENLMRKGKQTLEDWLRFVAPEYECIALRAGGYNIQPSQNIVKSMQIVGLKIDSSIYPGGKEIGTLSNYDYSSIKESAGFWYVGDELECEGDSDIIELPIVAFPIIRIKKFMSVERIKSLMQNRKSAKDSFEAKTSSNGKSSKLDKIKYFFQIEWQTWDFCLFSSLLHNTFLKQIEKQNRNVFVLVGHPKGFNGENSFLHLLKRTNKSFNYITINEFSKSMQIC